MRPSRYKEVNGDLVELALKGEFGVIVQGCNSFCKQFAGISKQFSETFETDNYLIYPLEHFKNKGLIDKLGNIEEHTGSISDGIYDIDKFNRPKQLTVINAYIQYEPGANAQCNALGLCLQKINHIYSNYTIGLPLIGCGIGGLDFNIVREMIKEELKDCYVTVVHYDK